MKIKLPTHVRFILETLNDMGYHAYIVGGCVRDSIIGRTPKDWDIVSNALPHEIEKSFSHTIPTGIEHGTVSVVLGGEIYEVTTFRIDGQYSDNRHPDDVRFVDNIIDDLARRDFTMNAMAYSDSDGLIDPFGGINDICNSLIRCVGNPDERFSEDALRMMRAFRFSAELNFSIEYKTLLSIRSHAELIANISAERIRDELNKMLIANAHILGELYDWGLLEYILPELAICFKCRQNNAYHYLDVGSHTIVATYEASNLMLKLAMLLHDIGKPLVKTTINKIDHFYDHQFVSHDLASKILRRLRYDNSTIKNVETLILHHMDALTPSKRVVKRALNSLGMETLLALLEVKAYDIYAQNPTYYHDRINELNLIREIIDEIVAEEEAFSLKDLAINGHDLIELGFIPGVELGKVLNELLEIVLEKPELNHRVYLLEFAKERL